MTGYTQRICCHLSSPVKLVLISRKHNWASDQITQDFSSGLTKIRSVLTKEKRQERRDYYCTTDHVFTLHTLIDKQTNQNKVKVFSYFDHFKKSFDSIWHERLLYKLMESGVGGKTYNIIKPMYTNNKSVVKIGKKTRISFHRPGGWDGEAV